MSACCCWPSWRRDLLFAVLGAVLSAAVLVPVGWSRLRAEQERAEAYERGLKAAEAEAKAAEDRARQQAMEVMNAMTQSLKP